MDFRGLGSTESRHSDAGFLNRDSDLSRTPWLCFANCYFRIGARGTTQILKILNFQDSLG